VVVACRCHYHCRFALLFVLRHLRATVFALSCHGILCRSVCLSFCGICFSCRGVRQSCFGVGDSCCGICCLCHMVSLCAAAFAASSCHGIVACRVATLRVESQRCVSSRNVVCIVRRAAALCVVQRPCTSFRNVALHSGVLCVIPGRRATPRNVALHSVVLRIVTGLAHPGGEVRVRKRGSASKEGGCVSKKGGCASKRGLRIKKGGCASKKGASQVVGRVSATALADWHSAQIFVWGKK